MIGDQAENAEAMDVTGITRSRFHHRHPIASRGSEQVDIVVSGRLGQNRENKGSIDRTKEALFLSAMRPSAGLA